MSTSDPRVEAVVEAMKDWGAPWAHRETLSLARAVLAALDAVPAPDRDVVFDALVDAHSENRNPDVEIDFRAAADAAIAAGAGTGQSGGLRLSSDGVDAAILQQALELYVEYGPEHEEHPDHVSGLFGAIAAMRGGPE